MENDKTKEEQEKDCENRLEAEKVMVDEKEDLSSVEYKPVDGPEGLGGWLILIGIGLVISPINLIIQARAYLPYLNSSTWHDISIVAKTQPFLKPTLFFEFGANLTHLVLIIALIILFFKRKRIFPKLAIVNYIYGIAILIIDGYLASNIIGWDSGEVFDSTTVRTIFTACIWIPYFLISKRVKNTFVK